MNLKLPRIFRILIPAALLAIILVHPSMSPGAEPSGGLPFLPGERLTFEVRWAFITAGEAVLEVLPREKYRGEEALRFVMTSRTTPFIDHFYKVRDRIESVTDAGLTRSLLYRKEKRGRRARDIVVTLDWERGEARYLREGEDWEPVPLIAGSFDPLSVFYAFRNHQLEVGKEIHEAVTDGKKCVMGSARVIGREEITVKGRRYSTYLVEPDLQDVGGVFDRGRDAGVRIWVTADSRRIPVRFESEVPLGSFVAELVSAEGIP